jgi:hypothetical protein
MIKPWSVQCRDFSWEHTLSVVNIVGAKRYRFTDRSNGYELPYYTSCHRSLLNIMKRYVEGGRKPL